MALTGMQIYKLLPKTNCKDCGILTCMAFAMQVAAKKRTILDCPHISEEAKNELSDAASPPMALVSIGTGDRSVEIGQETVLFRHEEKFHRKTRIAIRIPASLSDADAQAMAAGFSESAMVRVGEKMSVSLVFVEVDGVKDPASRVSLIAESGLPLVIAGTTEALGVATRAVKNHKPLIYRADASSLDALASLAAETGSSLAIHGKDIEELSMLTQKAQQRGAHHLVLSFDGSTCGESIRSLTMARRAALKSGFRPLGFPAIVDCTSVSPEIETVVASGFAAKYGGIVILGHHAPWELGPILTLIQDIYRDPQVPNAVEPKLYEIGNPTPDSPVILTTNFSLTYFSVASEVERSKVPAFISVVETEGLGVLNAYAGDKISVEKIVKTLSAQKVAERVTHRKLIIPGLIPMYRAEIEDTSEWKEVIIGPETAREIPAFLARTWKPDARQVRLSSDDRASQ